MKSETLQITTEINKKLFAWFIPTKESAPLVIIMHGWGSNAEHMLPIAATFHHAGLNTLVVDSRCHGKSDGDTYSALPRFAEDISHTVNYARENCHFNGQIVLLGHSVGAGASLFAASKRNDISAVISLSAFGHPQWLMTRYFKKFKLPQFLVNFLLFYIQMVIGHRFNDIAPVTSIGKLSIPTLIVHGTKDKTVPIEDAQLIQNNNSNGYLLIIEGADHESVDKLETHGQLLIDFLKEESLL
ncbi:MAG: alpha/beta fold hydrolase [gamma proteobacterium symbiont of Bathyaustriella thionipta]|nr:alpha/beta fold hydrolase [gamma proteobacterium symbiont of Bathyaustriella thionipta]MCU7951305.1 alpha/beta fold hydrolase [gamma proteobacterium symbiont of Bathyaustriella thionipta]MCU7952835.1 alpha/beta fold hydrolase [gamma proteobacterium symbiont of Bathyaustriella thionipta]MCU7967338.1 alpha/beta fold hydrolase [gamma proteobacterium symbiont of Bathyaustriella thionipta]